MKDTERRRFDMFTRVSVFGAEHADAFPAGSFAAEQLTIVNQVIDALESHMTAQESGRSASREGSLSKAVARDELIRDLEAMGRTARSMARSNPGLRDKFRVPHHESDQTVLAVARACAQHALPLKAEFIRRGMPASFLEDLRDKIEDLEQADTRKSQGKGKSVTATAAINREIERGMDAVRDLDPAMRNTFADDPAALAAWFSASHVERAPRGNPKPAPQSAGTQPAAKPN